MNNKIYFLGRKQGYSVHKYLPTKIENLRPYEAKGLQLAKCIDRTYYINMCDKQIQPQRKTPKTPFHAHKSRIVQPLDRKFVDLDHRQTFFHKIQFFWGLKCEMDPCQKWIFDLKKYEYGSKKSKNGRTCSKINRSVFVCSS